MDFRISQETLEKVFNYLAERPFKEVYQILQEVQKAVPMPETAEVKEPEEVKAPAKKTTKSGK